MQPRSTTLPRQNRQTERQAQRNGGDTNANQQTSRMSGRIQRRRVRGDPDHRNRRNREEPSARTIQIHRGDIQNTPEEFRHRFPVGVRLAVLTTTEVTKKSEERRRRIQRCPSPRNGPSRSISEGMPPMPLKRSKPLPAQCKATTPSGEPCRAKPHKEGLCFFHSDPKKAAELGRKGGRRRAV